MAKKSMIQRELKRIKLNKKYSEKRDNLLAKYLSSQDFESKIVIIIIYNHRSERDLSFIIYKCSA